MKIIVCNQDNGSGRIDALFRAFKASALEVMPGAEIVEVKFPPLDPSKRALMINQAFVAAANEALRSKEVCAVCDADLMFSRSIEDAEALPFDVAVTVRDRLKYNTGLWFYRPGPRAEDFVRCWIDASMDIYERVHGSRPDPQMINRNHEYGGIDQTALAFTVAVRDAEVLELPCQEWNATQTEWEAMTDKTRIIHIKSQLRNACFNKNNATPKGCADIVKRWRKYAGI